MADFILNHEKEAVCKCGDNDGRVFRYSGSSKSQNNLIETATVGDDELNSPWLSIIEH